MLERKLVFDEQATLGGMLTKLWQSVQKSRVVEIVLVESEDGQKKASVVGGSEGVAQCWEHRCFTWKMFRQLTGF